MANSVVGIQKSLDSTVTKPVVSQDILNSCRTVESLERLTSEYEMISELLKGLPEEPCDKSLAAKLKNELLETEAALQSLSNATAEAEQLKSDLKEMMSDVKEHIRENMDNYLFNITMRTSKLSTGNYVGTPSKNLSKSIDKDPSAAAARVPPANPNDADRGNEENQAEKANQKKEPVSTSVTAQEFQNVPDHIRGRLTLEKVNETLDMLRDVTQLKYRLLKKRKGLTVVEKDALMRMRSEIVPAVRETRFISEADIYLFKQKKLPKSTISHLIVLRHLQRIREVRDRNIMRIILKS